MDLLCWKMFSIIFKYHFNNICFFSSARNKNNRLCIVQHGIGQGEPIHLGGPTPRPHDPYVRILFQHRPCGLGKEGGRMSIRPYAEENKVEDRAIAPESLKQPLKLCLIDGSAVGGKAPVRHGVKLLDRERNPVHEVGLCRTEIAFRTFIGDQSFVCPEEVDPLPRDRRKVGRFRE
jgi:hypothetical protein